MINTETEEVQKYQLESREQIEDIIKLIRKYKRDEDFIASENIYTSHPFYLGYLGQRVWITPTKKLMIEGDLEEKMNEELMELV